MTRKEQVSNGFTEMMKGFWGNQDLEVPDFEEPCGDAISRILKRMWNCRGEHTTSIDKVKMEQIIRDELPSVTPQPKVGKWLYDKTIENWRCSICNETPKTLGYVGTDDFMAEHFKFCNHCGMKMGVSKDE